MAYSTQRAVSDGSLNLLDISLNYFDRADISVYFNNIVQNTGWSWVGATEKKISFTPNVPAGVEVLVVRTSDLEAIRHEYSGGAQFTAETLDENMRQLLYIAQEARENANIEDVYRDLNMHGYKLKNVGAGVDPADAITVQQATIFLDQAETAALLAEQWASGVGVVSDGKYSAKHYAEAAAASAASIDPASLLTKSGNLAGLASAVTARANLGLGTAATANSGDFQAAMPSATQAEMVAGTEPTLRAMSPLRVREALDAAFKCRAWVNFDGTRDNTGAASTANTARFIRASGNVASVVRVGTGQYVVNFATPMPTAYVCFPGGNNGGGGSVFNTALRAYTAFPRDLNSCGLGHYRTDIPAYDADSAECCVSVFC